MISGDADIVRLFFELDRNLHNYAAAVGDLRSARVLWDEERATVERWERSHAAALDMGAVLERKAIMERIELEKAKLESANRFASATYKACHDTLDRLAEKLTAVTDLPSPAPKRGS